MRYLLSLLLLIGMNVYGQEVKIPALSSPVMDTASLMNQGQREGLAQFAYEIYTNKGPQITILTVNDLQGFAIEDFSIKVAEKWQLGTKKAGNGILVLISKNDRQMRIEVGEGIEGEITDYDTAQFTRRIFPEYFRRGDYYGGLKLFMEDTASRFGIKETSSTPYVRRVASSRQGSPLGGALPFFVIILAISYVVARNKPGLRGVLSAAGMGGVGWLMIPGIGAGIIFLMILGFGIGIIGIGNILMGLASSGGGRYHGGGGGGGWSGGGGGFSGGGSSGNW